MVSLMLAVADALILAYTWVAERLPLVDGESQTSLLKPEELFCDISHPVGARRSTLSPLPSPLPLTVKLVVAPAVPTVVVGNVNEVGLTFSTGEFAWISNELKLVDEFSASKRTFPEIPDTLPSSQYCMIAQVLHGPVLAG